MRKLSWKPTNRTWLLVALAVIAAIVGLWTLKRGEAARRAAAPAPAAVALSPAAEQARGALQARLGQPVDLLYVLEPSEKVVCGYYGQQAQGRQPVRAASFVFQNGVLVLAADKGSEYRAFQKQACGPQWSAPLG